MTRSVTDCDPVSTSSESMSMESPTSSSPLISLHRPQSPCFSRSCLEFTDRYLHRRKKFRAVSRLRLCGRLRRLLWCRLLSGLFRCRVRVQAGASRHYSRRPCDSNARHNSEHRRNLLIKASCARASDGAWTSRGSRRKNLVQNFSKHTWLIGIQP